MSSPVRYAAPSHHCFSPRVLRRLEARLEKIAKERKNSGEWDNDGNDDEDDEACEGRDAKNGGYGGHGPAHLGSHDRDGGDADNDSLRLGTPSNAMSVHRSSPTNSRLGSPILSRPKEDPNGLPSATALRGLSLVEGKHPGYFAEDSYIRPAASDLEIDEDYWVKYDYPALRALLQVPTEDLPDSNRTFAPLPTTPANGPRRRFREKMEESGYLVRGRRVYSRNSPERYRFVPLHRLGDAKRSTRAEEDGGADNGVGGDDAHGTDDGTDDGEWVFVSTWPEAEEAEALLELPSIRGFPRSLRL